MSPIKPKAKAAAKPAAEAQTTDEQHRREVTGLVVSNKMQKTITVQVQRHVEHTQYKKYVRSYRKVKAHDETNQAKPGDLVLLVESRPLSKDKRWALKEILRKAAQVEEVNV